MGLGMTMVLVDRDTLKMLDEAIEHLDEAISYGAIAEDDAGMTRSDLIKMRDRVKVALG